MQNDTVPPPDAKQALEDLLRALEPLLCSGHFYKVELAHPTLNLWPAYSRALDAVGMKVPGDDK